MWPIGGDIWTFSIRDHPEVDFCVWSLRRDGLRLTPFDRHSDGDASLRNAGLTAAAWWAWLTAVVGVVAAADGRRQWENVELMERHFRERGRPPVNQELRELAARPDGRAPAALDLWKGPAGGRRVLADLRDQYLWERRERGRERMRDVGRATAAQNETSARRSRQLWNEMQQYRPLPPLFFYQVDYPVPVLAAMPPAAAVLGGIDVSGQLDPAYDRLVLRAAALLAGRCSRPRPRQ
jgi:hypothetical protein